MAFLGGRKRNEEEEEDGREMGTEDVTVLHQAAKMSGLDEQVQRKQRTGKAVDHVPPAHKLVVAGRVPGEGAQLFPGFFMSSLCIFEARHCLCPA